MIVFVNTCTFKYIQFGQNLPNRRSTQLCIKYETKCN